MNEEKSDRGYYMVRAMHQADKHFDLFFKEGVVAIGWSRVDVRNLNSKEEVSEALDRSYDFWSDTAPRVRGKKENEILRFNSIRDGDRIVVPFHSSIALATATSDHRYVPEVRESHDLSNQTFVDYERQDGDIAAVPREELSEGLQRRLRVRGSTVSDLREFADEIESLFQGEEFSWQARMEKEEEKRRRDFRDDLLNNIRDGRTNLKAGGIGLENLVAALLRYDGYQADVLSKATFPGFADADVKASQSDRFGERQLLVQVKHHQGTTGTWGAEQLRSILDEEPAQYSDYQLVLVTTGTMSSELKALCERNDIHYMDGDDLADWIVDHVDTLDANLRRKLGISAVPELTL